MQLHYHGHCYDFSCNLLGDFYISNILAAILASSEFCPDTDKLIDYAQQCTAPLGRMEIIARKENNAIIVDFAHTPDALKKSLIALKNHHKNGRIIVVFGCGGNRDKDKRPIMGKIAHDYADIQIVTNDNPRDENPDAIREAIITTCPNAINIGKRDDAIHHAIHLMRDGDFLLVAGKGHENTQTIGNQKIIFQDQDVIRDTIKQYDNWII